MLKTLGLMGVVVVLAACGPWGRTPGFRLFGEVVRQPVRDWSFTDDHSTIAVQTRTRYGIPHSVTTVCFRHRGALYVPARNPHGKRWIANVLRRPEVRLRIGDQIYERRALRVTDESLIEELSQALATKYDRMRSAHDPRPELWFFRMEAREESAASHGG